MTAVREEIRDMILDAATFALKETHGPPQDDDRQTLLEYFMSKIDSYAGRYPVIDLLNEFQTASDAGHLATIVTRTADEKQDRLPTGSKLGITPDNGHMGRRHQAQCRRGEKITLPESWSALQ